MTSRQVSILDGSTFMVSDDSGDVGAGGQPLDGLFYRDIRHLSRWELRLNGRRPHALAGDLTEYDTAVFYLTEPTASAFDGPPVTVLRQRRIGNGLTERLTVTNHTAQELALLLDVLFAADFADLFEVKNKLPKTGTHKTSVERDRVTMEYAHGDFRRGTVIRSEGAFLADQVLTFQIRLEPGQRWQTEIEVSLSSNDHAPAVKRERHPNIDQSLDEWLAAAPRLDTDWADLAHAYHRSLVDLAALRFYPDVTPCSSVPAAGLPWYMALFGRDSLVTSYQALPYLPELARTTLRALAARQATAVDDFRDAEPGKILHELRHGELAHFHQQPQSPYYGTADATPLFLILLDEYERWTGDAALVHELEGAARAALRWMEVYGDSDGDGFIEYRTRNPDTGLANHCWKDSWNSILYPDGRLASSPRATCELQGYAYDARRRMSRLARECWGDDTLADRLDRDAAGLHERFNDVYWLPDQGFYALALDGDKRLVPTLTSNIGHLLWSGIVPDDRVDAVVGHLLGERMFAGWGVRTLAAGQPAFNPVEYHNGTVWPHDNALIAAGLARYGRRAEANRIAVALLEAARHFDHRLPEVFVGADRSVTRVPVRYPTACSPQAWASGAPLLLLRTVLGLSPRVDGFAVDAHLPGHVGRLAVRGVTGRWGLVDAIA
ncbi:amylo-alpha-1,6-glucosidase [Planosporangium thailandense]|uniref:Amylo-alpha-1,6-glucosidase n=1 Tax=Planosporangium thailandense TaxID=765197 RepID=A0ABX0Y1J1_9ACTN|nr:amylo-alpha-1,6-glucosidase [Planosporangium thailandense]